MRRSLASNALTALVLLIFLATGVLMWALRQYSDAGPLEQAICLQVPLGTNMGRVSENLLDQGAISSSAIFRIGVDYADKTTALKAGSYLVPEQASMSEIADIVTRGGASTCGTEVVYRIGVNRVQAQVRELDPTTQRFDTVAEFDPISEEDPADYLRVLDEQDTRYRVAVAEGVTSWQVVEGLKSVDVLDGNVEIPAEGSLAPDSYEISKGDSRVEVLSRMEDAQTALLTAAWVGRDDDLPLNSPEEALILASIIEKETGVAEERRQVASVFINRLNRGMRLQTDPTVIYGITKGQGVLGRGLRRSELRARTPYNTYVIDALPPTPIANPGRAAIQAALQPDQTNFVFFVADGTGGHAFAETLAEHNQNVAKWREIEAQQ